MSHAGAGTIGLSDPESMIYCLGWASFDESALALLKSAFGEDVMLTLCNEAVNAGDEWRVREDRFGRCLTQSDIVRVYLDI